MESIADAVEENLRQKAQKASAKSTKRREPRVEKLRHAEALRRGGEHDTDANIEVYKKLMGTLTRCGPNAWEILRALPKTASGDRIYDHDVVEEVRKRQRVRGLKLTVKECLSLLSVTHDHLEGEAATIRTSDEEQASSLGEALPNIQVKVEQQDENNGEEQLGGAGSGLGLLYEAEENAHPGAEDVVMGDAGDDYDMMDGLEMDDSAAAWVDSMLGHLLAGGDEFGADFASGGLGVSAGMMDFRYDDMFSGAGDHTSFGIAGGLAEADAAFQTREQMEAGAEASNPSAASSSGATAAATTAAAGSSSGSVLGSAERAAPPIKSHEFYWVVPKEVSQEVFSPEQRSGINAALDRMTKSTKNLTFADLVPLFKYEEFTATGVAVLKEKYSDGAGMQVFAKRTEFLRKYEQLSWLQWFDFKKPGFDQRGLPPPPGWVLAKDKELAEKVTQAKSASFRNKMQDLCSRREVEAATKALTVAKHKFPDHYKAMLEVAASSSIWGEFHEIVITVSTLTTALKQKGIELKNHCVGPLYTHSANNTLALPPTCELSDLQEVRNAIGNASKTLIEYEPIRVTVLKMLDRLITNGVDKLGESVGRLLAIATEHDFLVAQTGRTTRPLLDCALKNFEPEHYRHRQAQRLLLYFRFDVNGEELAKKCESAFLLPHDPIYATGLAVITGQPRAEVLGVVQMLPTRTPDENRQDVMQDEDMVDDLIAVCDKIRMRAQRYFDKTTFAKICGVASDLTEMKIEKLRAAKASKKRANANAGLDDAEDAGDGMALGPKMKVPKPEPANLQAAKAKMHNNNGSASGAASSSSSRNAGYGKAFGKGAADVHDPDLMEVFADLGL